MQPLPRVEVTSNSCDAAYKISRNSYGVRHTCFKAYVQYITKKLREEIILLQRIKSFTLFTCRMKNGIKNVRRSSSFVTKLLELLLNQTTVNYR